MPDPEEAEFLRQIVAMPADDTLRMVYADWLSDHDREREAAFIRDCPELKRTRIRYGHWEWRHYRPGDRHSSFGVPYPFGELADRVLEGQYPRRELTRYTVRRGFLDSVEFDFATKWTWNARLRARLSFSYPLRKVVFDTTPAVDRDPRTPNGWTLVSLSPMPVVDVGGDTLRLHEISLLVCRNYWPGIDFAYTDRLQQEVDRDGFIPWSGYRWQ